MSARIFIGLGSNLGDRAAYLKRAIEGLSMLEHTSVKRCSSTYETEPVGIKEQPSFLNTVVELESSRSPHELIGEMKKIELRLGRTRRERWGPREIDLDLLYYGDVIVHEPDVRVPHAEIDRRRFVLVPMKEIAAKFLDPLRQQTIEQLLRACSDTSLVRKISSKRPEST